MSENPPSFNSLPTALQRLSSRTNQFENVCLAANQRGARPPLFLSVFNCCLERLRRKRPEPRRQRRRCSSLHTRLHPLSPSPPDLSFSSRTLLKGPRCDAPHPVQNMPTSPPSPPLSDNRQLYQHAQRRQSRLPASRCSQSKAFKLPCRGPKWRSRFSACDADAFGRINKHRGSLWGFFLSQIKPLFLRH